MTRETEGLVVPKLETEAEEARWWYKNRDKVEDALLKAIDNGTIESGVAQRLTRQARASRNVTLRMAEADLGSWTQTGQRQGITVANLTYIKSVLHEKLVKRERQKAN